MTVVKAEEMEDKNVNVCNKRKDIIDDIDEDPVVLKKARYSWQIKNTCPDTTTSADKRTLVIQDLDDLSITFNNSNYTDNLENKDKINSQKEHSKLIVNEKITSNQVSVDIPVDKVNDQEYSYKQNTLTVPLKECIKPNDNSTPSTSTDNVTKSGKKDLSVYLSELENENLHRPSVYPSHLDINLTSSCSSGQRSEDIFNSSDSEAEEEGLLFSSPQRCTNSLDFDLHLARWQNQHAAKAIVDNAINKTLEEMGVSPEEDLDEFAADKNFVEDEGISEAIRRQGLVRHPENQGASFHQENSHSSVEEQSSVEETQYPEKAVNHQDKERSNLEHTNPEPHSDLQRKHRDQKDLHQNLTISQNSNRSSQHCCSEELNAKLCSSSGNLNVSTSSYADRCIPVSSNDLIDQAVTMAICSQGLALQNNVL